MRLLAPSSEHLFPQELCGTWHVVSYVTSDGQQADTDDLWVVEEEGLHTSESDFQIQSVKHLQDWNKECLLVSYTDSPIQHLFLFSECEPDRILVRAYFQREERLRLMLQRVNVLFETSQSLRASAAALPLVDSHTG